MGSSGTGKDAGAVGVAAVKLLVLSRKG